MSSSEEILPSNGQLLGVFAEPAILMDMFLYSQACSCYLAWRPICFLAAHTLSIHSHGSHPAIGLMPSGKFPARHHVVISGGIPQRDLNPKQLMLECLDHSPACSLSFSADCRLLIAAFYAAHVC